MHKQPPSRGERLAQWLTCCLALAASLPAWGGKTGEFLVFPNINAVYRDESVDLAGHHSLPRDRTEPTVDFFYSSDFGRLRLLGEFFVSSSKNHGTHFERLEAGWRWHRAARLWIGRFHNPVGYWNTQYHHGNYLETAVSRPAIVTYEHDGGILPLHVVGAGLEGSWPRGEGELGYDLAVGLGPEIKEHGLEALNIMDPEGNHDPVFTLRLRYQPQEDGPDQYGLFISRSAMPGRELDQVTQTMAGVYANRQGSRLRLTGALFGVRHEYAHLSDSRFVNGYLQAELALGMRWTVFARIEGNYGDGDDALVGEVASFVHERQLGGLRMELGQTQAIKVELSNTTYQCNHTEQVMLQWSAVIP